MFDHSVLSVEICSFAVYRSYLLITICVIHIFSVLRLLGPLINPFSLQPFFSVKYFWMLIMLGLVVNLFYQSSSSVYNWGLSYTLADAGKNIVIM